MSFEQLTPDVIHQKRRVPPIYGEELYDHVLPDGEHFYDIPEFIPEEEEKQSIFTYFDIDNEVAFAQRQLQKGTSVEGVKTLLTNEVICFLEEFAGKVDTAKISYNWDNGQLYAPGAAESALESWTRWAEHTNGEREWGDAFGFQKIQEAFQKGEATIAIQLSPPSIGVEGFGTYGFCNVYINKGPHMDLFLLKYTGEDAHLNVSNTMMRELRPEHEATSNAADFLTEPVLFTPASPQELTLKLEQLGFGSDVDLEAANEFSTTIRKELSTWTDQFNNTVLAMAEVESNDEYQLLYNRAKLLLAACYNKAKDVKIHLEGGTSSFVTRSSVDSLEDPAFEQEELERYALLDTAYVVGGGTCPAGTSANELTQSISEMLIDRAGAVGYGEALQIVDIRGQQLATSKDKDTLKCTCPFCNQKVEAKIDRQKKTISCTNSGCKKSAPYNC